LERSIIFEDVPADIKAPVVVEVTITDRVDVTDPSTGFQRAVMNAQVEKVVRGSIGQGPLKIVVDIDDCTTGFGAGSHGIVIGAVRRDSRGDSELVAISESKAERWDRKARERTR
jgi:hypothetical protein